MNDNLNNHQIVSNSEWTEARKAFLRKRNLQTYVSNLVRNDAIYHGYQLIKSMFLRDRMENRLSPNFLTEEAN